MELSNQPGNSIALAQPGGILVEPTSNHPQPSHGGTLVQNLVNPGGTTPDHSQPSQNLVEPTLVKPCLKPPQTTPNLVERSWNPRGTFNQGRPGPPRTLSGLRPQSFQLLGKKQNS